MLLLLLLLRRRRRRRSATRRGACTNKQNVSALKFSASSLIVQRLATVSRDASANKKLGPRSRICRGGDCDCDASVVVVVAERRAEQASFSRGRVKTSCSARERARFAILHVVVVVVAAVSRGVVASVCVLCSVFTVRQAEPQPEPQSMQRLSRSRSRSRRQQQPFPFIMTQLFVTLAQRWPALGARARQQEGYGNPPPNAYHARVDHHHCRSRCRDDDVLARQQHTHTNTHTHTKAPTHLWTALPGRASLVSFINAGRQSTRSKRVSPGPRPL